MSSVIVKRMPSVVVQLMPSVIVKLVPSVTMRFSPLINHSFVRLLWRCGCRGQGELGRRRAALEALRRDLVREALQYNSIIVSLDLRFLYFFFVSVHLSSLFTIVN